MDGWIVVPNWEKFQHYPDDRAIVWLKDYLDQLDREEYGELTFAERGVLVDIRKLYARRRGLVRSDTRSLSRALNGRVTQQQLEALNHAGFIEIVASKPLALRALARKEVEGEKEKRRLSLASEGEKPVKPPASPPIEGAERKITLMIQNGVIHDHVDLEAEILGYRINGDLADRLRALL